ncbi:hypothetical protein [Patulibacter sp. SYSU D01012]|uniref:hypothetical protein n=1 Tax=Patulibacter sp. SYSU D01012 TaxID=2817381 RepID=UPI001B31373F|nr:hypothetical protein [Patulibacter sp. SYSU D01012]
MTAWHSALLEQLAAGGAGASLFTMGPGTVLEEVGNTCEATLAGHGATNRDDRVSLSEDAYDMCRGLGPATVAAIGPALRNFRSALGAKELETGPGARSASLAAQVLSERLRLPDVAAAAWDDVVEAFENADVDAGVGEDRILVLSRMPGGSSLFRVSLVQSSESRWALGLWSAP